MLQFPSYKTITVQVISKSIGLLQSYMSLNIQNIARVNFKQWSFIVLQENLNLANVKNNLRGNLLSASYVHSFWAAKKPRALLKPFLHTRPLNFWLCLHIFEVYGEKSVQEAGRKTVSTRFFLG